MRGAILLLVTCLFVFPARLAHAEAKDKCAGAEGVAPDLADACNQAVYDKCRPAYQKRCVDGILRDYRSRSQERGAPGGGPSASTSDAVCDAEPFVTECKKALAYAKDVCSVHGNAAGDKKPGELETWLKRFGAVPEAKAHWAAFALKYPLCTKSKYTCSYNEFDRDACLTADVTYRTKWTEYRTDLARKVELAKHDVGRLAKNPLDWGASPVFDMLGKHLEEASKFMVFAYLNADAKEIEGWTRWLAGEKTKWLSNREAALAKVRCPEPTNKDKALAAALRRVLDEHGKASRDPNAKMVETVGTFGLLGKAVQSHQALPPVTHEDQGGFGCVRQEKEGKTTCRVLTFTFRRSKPGGGKFGAWGFFSVGGGDEMSCKNLK